MTDTVSLREHVDEKFAAVDKAVLAALSAQEKAISAALAAADRAVAKAEAAAEKRFESVNEFRETLTDQARTFMPRSEAEQLVKAINEKLGALTSRLEARENRGRGMGDVWGIILGAVAVAGALFAIFRG